MKKKFLTPEQKKEKLIKSLPIDEDGGVIITAFGYDTDMNGELADGAVLITEKEIISYIDRKPVYRIVIADCEKFEYRMLVGVCELTATDKDGEHLICRSSASNSEIVAKNAHRLQLYKETGKYIPDSEMKLVKVCPKCGRELKGRVTVCVKCADKKSMFARLFKMSLPYKWYIIASVLLFAVGVALSLLGPYVNKLLVDGYIDNASVKETARTSGLTAVIGGFLFTVLLMVLLRIGSSVITSLRNLSVMQAGTGLIIDLRSMVFEKIQQMSVKTLSRRTSGELMRRVTADTGQIENFIVGQMPNIVTQVIMLIAVGVILFIYDPFLAFLVLIPVPLCIFIIYFANEYFRTIYARQWEAESRSGSVLFDIFSGIRVVKAYRTEKKEYDRYDKAASDERDIAIRNETNFNILDPIIMFIFNIGTMLLLYYTGSKILGRTMTLGEAAMLSTYVYML